MSRLVSAIRFLFQAEEVMAKLDDVITKVAEIEGVVDSVIEFIDWLKAELAEAGGDQAKIDEIMVRLDAQKAELAAAIANDPTPPPVE